LNEALLLLVNVKRAGIWANDVGWPIINGLETEEKTNMLCARSMQ